MSGILRRDVPLTNGTIPIIDIICYEPLLPFNQQYLDKIVHTQMFKFIHHTAQLRIRQHGFTSDKSIFLALADFLPLIIDEL